MAATAIAAPTAKTIIPPIARVYDAYNVRVALPPRLLFTVMLPGFVAQARSPL
jgi:hypothetical protein